MNAAPRDLFRLRERWERLSGRFDALTRQQRALAFVAGLGFTALSLHLFVLAPVVDHGRALTREITRTRSDAGALHEQLQALALARQRDPDAPLRERLEAAKFRLATLDAQINRLRQQLISPDRMASVLREILTRSKGLELIEMKSIAPEPLEPAPAKASPEAGAGTQAAASNPSSDAAQPPSIYRHGLELRVRGSYLDQLRYLVELERMPYQMFWREVEISAERYPEIVMRLTVYTISLDKAYLAL